MNDQFARQAQDMFAAAKDARIPDNVKVIAEESVAKSREVFEKMTAAAKDNAKTVEHQVLATQAGMKAISEKVLHNTTANAEALFDAAQAIVRAKTLPEAARLQADFLQQSFAIATQQTKELFDLSTKIAQSNFHSMQTAATHTMDQVKKAG